MEERFQKLIDSDFSDIAGLTANASVPVSQSLINDLLAAALQANKTIEACRAAIHEQNRVSVRLKIKALPWALDLKLKLYRSVDLASFSSPKVRMWLENKRLLGSLGSFLNLLPEWAKLYGNQVVIDLGAFLPPEQKRLFALLKSVEIGTEEGKVVFDVKIKVD